MKRSTFVLSLALASLVASARAQESLEVDSNVLSRTLRRYGREPSVETVVRWALAASAPAARSTHSLQSRARSSGWVPLIRVNVRSGYGRDRSALLRADGGHTNWSSDEQLALSTSLLFRLDRLVFAPEEVSITREGRARGQARAQLAARVVSLFFERRRLQIESDLVGSCSLRHAASLAEINANLRILTGGRFPSGPVHVCTLR
jgi:hypothetical protein